MATYKDSSPNLFIVVYSPVCYCSKPVWMFVFFWTQKKIFWRMLITKHLLVAIDFHSFVLPTFFKIAAFFKAQLLASLILFFLVVDNGIRLGICEHLEKILMQLLHDCHQHISQYPGSLYTWLNKFLQLQRHCSGSILAHPEPGGFRPPTLFLIFQSRHILSIYVQ